MRLESTWLRSPDLDGEGDHLFGKVPEPPLKCFKALGRASWTSIEKTLTPLGSSSWPGRLGESTWTAFPGLGLGL